MIPAGQQDTALTWLTAGLLCIGFGVSPSLNHAQTAAAVGSQVPQGTALSWVQEAAVHEQKIIQDDGSFPVRYRVRQAGAKGDMTREVIESKQGSVARMVQHNGQNLTAAEDAAERQRLEEILRSPDAFIKHHKRDEESRQYSIDLVSQMPKAMIFKYAPGQPQPANATGPQVVIDFEPDPSYKPHDMVCDALTGIHGRMWIDAKSHHLTRIEGSILHQVNFGWGGLIARISPGGTVEFEQVNAGQDRWVYSHLDEHLTIRALLVKTIPENNLMTATDFRLLPAPMSVQEAVHTLLAMPIPLR